jgi:hypothetical protein
LLSFLHILFSLSILSEFLGLCDHFCYEVCFIRYEHCICTLPDFRIYLFGKSFSILLPKTNVFLYQWDVFLVGNICLGLAFKIQFPILCLLIKESRPLTFRANIERYVVFPVTFFVWGMFTPFLFLVYQSTSLVVFILFYIFLIVFIFLFCVEDSFK